MEKTITVNRLPVRTWNRLNMNEARLLAKQAADCCTPELSGIGAGISWEKQETDREIKTGMGEELQTLNPEAAENKADTLRIEAENCCEAPVIVTYSCLPGKDYFNRMQITAEKNSSVNVIVVFRSPEEFENYAALQMRVRAKEGAAVKVYLAQLLGKNSTCFCDMGSVCERAAVVELTQLQLGAGTLYAGGLAQLDGDDSVFGLDIGYMEHKDDHFDMNYIARHIGKRTVSRMMAHGVLRDQAFKLFRGTIDFVSGCGEAKGVEQEEVLLLGKDVINQTIPLILCGEENVEGSHGATIGSLDARMLFYLGARGFAREEAERLVARAKIDALCATIPAELIRKNVQNYLEDMENA